MVVGLELEVAMDEDTRFPDVLCEGVGSDYHVRSIGGKLIHLPYGPHAYISKISRGYK
jgi:hypothetical protein